ncbi:MAG: TIGR00159 family protein [Bacteroidia bacterium]|nr:TIGR00159 family protein [Bacteroidia bacterium]
MPPLFIHVRFFDVIDIFLVAVLLYQFYRLIKGTVAINIFIGIFSLYLIWLIVKAFRMELLSSILSQFISVGMIALIVVFQQELRRFLIVIGTRYFKSKKFSFDKMFTLNPRAVSISVIDSIIHACENMAKTKTGALIVVSNMAELRTYTHTGDMINADVSSRLIENLFFKNSPLHDGAAIIIGNKVRAARCILPLSNNPNIPANFGLRHRAALGMSEETDTLVIIISEETGNISYAKDGKLIDDISTKELIRQLKITLL